MKITKQGLTYEEKDTSCPKELYEWTHVWQENAPDEETVRVLYVGDSISECNRPEMNRLANGELLVDGFATSKALDNPNYLPFLKLFAEEEGHREVVLFNNGLHGWHLSEEEYEVAYERLALALREAAPAKKMLLLLTTRVKDEDRTRRVQARNEAVRRIAARHGFPIVDLYALSEQHFDLLSSDGVHFTPAASAIFAEALLQEIRAILS